MSVFQVESHQRSGQTLRQTLNVSNSKDRVIPATFPPPYFSLQFMAPLLEEAPAPATTAAPEAPAAPKIETPKEVKKPSAWKLFGTVLTQNGFFS